MVNSEEWCDIPSYEGLYQVSDLGRVKSLPKAVLDPSGRVRNYGERVLKQQPVNKYGHLKVGLYKEGVRTEILVHRLVLMAFVRLPWDGEEALHGDGNPTNNMLENLKWGTSKDNSDDCRNHGKIAVGEQLPQTKLSVEEVLLIRADQRSSTLIAVDYGVSARHIRGIKSNKYWKHI